MSYMDCKFDEFEALLANLLKQEKYDELFNVLLTRILHLFNSDVLLRHEIEYLLNISKYLGFGYYRDLLLKDESFDPWFISLINVLLASDNEEFSDSINLKSDLVYVLDNLNLSKQNFIINKIFLSMIDGGFYIEASSFADKYRDKIWNANYEFIKNKNANNLFQKANLIEHDNKKPTFIITLSGFVRDYQSAHHLNKQVNFLRSKYNVYVFAAIFDRLGNMRRPMGLNPALFDFDNGVLFREIQKTKKINIEYFHNIFDLYGCTCEARESDDYYIKEIGISHPQWYMVNKSFELTSSLYRKIIENSNQPVLAARIRFDFYSVNHDSLLTAADDLIANHLPSDILTHDIWNFGYFSISDRLAIGHYQAIQHYTSIGSSKNFIDLEKTPYWIENIKQSHDSSPRVNLSAGGVHETHVGLWIKLGGLNVFKKSYLNP